MWGPGSEIFEGGWGDGWPEIVRVALRARVCCDFGAGAGRISGCQIWPVLRVSAAGAGDR